jgi:hypothetical protein
MKNVVTYFTIVMAIILFAACQKELNFEPIPNNGFAIGTLKSTSGNCLPKKVNGVYKKDETLTSTNFIEVTVDITTVGNYIIKSDTIAGFSFIGIGTVTATGLNTIKLIGEGTPDSIGTKSFTIKFDTSVCKVDVNVVTAVNPNAVYTFAGAPGSCSGATTGAGVYTVGLPVGATHTVTLNVAVTNPGLYTINTGTLINGLSFSGAGTFAANGTLPVVLTATGIPNAAGSFNYTASNGTSSCTFTITVVAAPPAANLDYIPQTSFTNWSSRLVGGTPSDTTYIQVSANSKTFGANSYKIFERKILGNPVDSFYNRKNGGLYYQYLDGNLGVLDNPIDKEYLVLDSTKAIGGTWIGNLGANAAGGIPISSITINAVILGKGETRTVSSISYNNVIRVKYTYTATIFGLPTSVADEERWFAKGIGVIYSIINNQIGGTTIETELTRSQVF